MAVVITTSPYVCPLSLHAHLDPALGGGCLQSHPLALPQRQDPGTGVHVEMVPAWKHGPSPFWVQAPGQGSVF